MRLINDSGGYQALDVTSRQFAIRDGVVVSHPTTVSKSTHKATSNLFAPNID